MSLPEDHVLHEKGLPNHEPPETVTPELEPLLQSGILVENFTSLKIQSFTWVQGWLLDERLIIVDWVVKVSL